MWKISGFFLGGKAHHFGDEHVHCRKIQLIDGENPNSVRKSKFLLSNFCSMWKKWEDKMFSGDWGHFGKKSIIDCHH